MSLPLNLTDICPDQIFFSPKTFRGQTFLLDPKEPKILLDLIFFAPNFFWGVDFILVS